MNLASKILLTVLIGAFWLFGVWASGEAEMPAFAVFLTAVFGCVDALMWMNT